MAAHQSKWIIDVSDVRIRRHLKHDHAARLAKLAELRAKHKELRSKMFQTESQATAILNVLPEEDQPFMEVCEVAWL